MALNIPNVEAPGTGFLKGLNAGGNLYSRIMAPKLKREELEFLKQKHQEDLALRKAAAGRAAAAASDAHKLAMMRLDPMREIKQLEMLSNYMNQGKGQVAPTQEQSFMPSIGGQFGQQPMQEPEQGQFPALQEMIMQGSMPQQQDVPALNEQAISPMEAGQQKPSNGLDMEAIKKSPVLRGWFKKHYGIDPGAEIKSSAFTGAAREGLDMARLKKEFGENSEEYRNAQSIQQSKENQRKDLSDKRTRELHGLKPGDVAIHDPETGEEVGFSKQLDKDQRMQEENKVKFDMIYPYVYEGGSVLSGPGATAKLEKAAREYKTNPKARKIIDDFLIADKALTNATVTEAARFGSGKQNQVFNRYRESLQSEDIHHKLKDIIKKYEIPAEANLRAGKRWKQILDEVDEKSKKMVPARRNYYYDPEKQYTHDEEMHRGEKSAAETYHDNEMVKVEGPNGIEVMTYAEAKRKGAL